MASGSGRLDVGVIGAGRAGVPIAAALADAGHRLRGISTASEQNRERVAAMLPGTAVLPIPDLIEASDLVVLAIPDDQIAPLTAGIAEAGLLRAGQILLHLAAAFGADVLAPASRLGVIPLALHPNMVFTGTSIDRTRLREVTAAVTAPAPVLPIAQALAIELGCDPIVIAEADRRAYAEALDVVSSFSRSVIEQGAGILRTIGVDRPAAVLASIARSSVNEALARSGRPDGPMTLDEEDE